jgi:hypothetical protein
MGDGPGYGYSLKLITKLSNVTAQDAFNFARDGVSTS